MSAKARVLFHSFKESDLYKIERCLPLKTLSPSFIKFG